MKRMIGWSLAALLVFSLAGCAKPADKPQLSSEERTTLYQTAIENARDAETNEYNPIATDPDSLGPFALDLLGVSLEDLNSYAISVSAMNIRAYGIAAIYPAAGKSEVVLEGLHSFVDAQKRNFDQYLADQYDIASNARVETLEDGTLLLVMCENQDAVFDSIKDAIEAGGT